MDVLGTGSEDKWYGTSLGNQKAIEPQCKVDDATVCYKWTSSVQMLTPAGKRSLEMKGGGK